MILLFKKLFQELRVPLFICLIAAASHIFLHTPAHAFRSFYANLPNSVPGLVVSYHLVQPVTMCRQNDLPLWISSSSHLKWVLAFLKWRSLTVTLRWQSDNGTNSLQLFDFTAAGRH